MEFLRVIEGLRIVSSLHDSIIVVERKINDGSVDTFMFLMHILGILCLFLLPVNWLFRSKSFNMWRLNNSYGFRLDVRSAH